MYSWGRYLALVLVGLCLLSGKPAAVASGATIDPLLAGTTPVAISDLPAPWSGYPPEQLAAQLAQLTAPDEPDLPWWRVNLSREDAEIVRLAALASGDRQLAVRGLYWLAKDLRYGDDVLPLALSYIELGLREAGELGLTSEPAQLMLLQGELWEDGRLYLSALTSYRQARTQLETAGDLAGLAWELHKEANVLGHRLGRYADAVSAYQQRDAVLQASQATAQARLPGLMLCAYNLEELGRYSAAAEQFDAALTLAQEEGDLDSIFSALTGRLALQLDLGNLPAARITAEEMLARVAQAPPADVNHWPELDPQYHQLLVADQPAEAAALAQEMLELLRRAMAEVAQTGTARSDYVQERLNGQRAQILLWLARAQQAQGAATEALATLAEIDIDNPASPLFLDRQWHIARGRALVDLGRVAEALAEFDAAANNEILQAFHPGDYVDCEVLCLKGDAFLQLGEYDEAEASFSAARRPVEETQARTIALNNARALRGLARVALAEGRTGEALDLSEQAQALCRSVIDGLPYCLTLLQSASQLAREIAQDVEGLDGDAVTQIRALEISNCAIALRNQIAFACGSHDWQQHAGAEAAALVQRCREVSTQHYLLLEQLENDGAWLDPADKAVLMNEVAERVSAGDAELKQRWIDETRAIEGEKLELAARLAEDEALALAQLKAIAPDLAQLVSVKSE